MKASISLMLGAVLALLPGLVSAAPVLAAVGPNPYAPQTVSTGGHLEVFSALEGHSEGDNPPWYQHADYYLLDRQGRELRHVYNVVGYYAQAPRPVALSAGQYLVKAPAKNGCWLEVPVVIEPGRTTRVHLDGDWKYPAGTPGAALVDSPAGYPVGWRYGAPL